MADKPKKPQKLRARLPRGFEDRDTSVIAATRTMTGKIRAVYERYGFEPVETPEIEFTDALGKFLPDQDRPNEGVFSFRDDDEQWLSLRYDLTAPLARHVAENFQKLTLPYRSYRAGYVFRNEKPGPGRFRQFMQFDADTVGSASPAADAEMCMMAADTMEALGIPRGRYVVKVNNRKMLDGVMESIGLGGDENARRRLVALRAIDKHDRLGDGGVRSLLGEGRWDGGEPGKGDFTPGAGLATASIDNLLRWLNFKELYQKFQGGQAEFAIPNPYYLPPSEWRESDPRLNWGIGAINRSGKSRTPSANWDMLGALARVFYDNNPTLLEGFAELEAICDFIEASDFGEQVQIDPSVVRGLEYYTGAVFEVELLLQSEDEGGHPVRFGSVGGGGRYDGLVSRFIGQIVPATGFSIGVSRLQAALTALGGIDKRPRIGPILVTVFGGAIEHYQRYVLMLRKAGIPAELYLGNAKKGIGAQLKYADKRNSPCAIVQGSEEYARRVVIIKDLIMGTEAALFHSAVGTSREEYLDERPAQFEVPEQEVVEAVLHVLRRNNIIFGQASSDDEAYLRRLGP